jgi:aerotaxis receptor
MWDRLLSGQVMAAYVQNLAGTAATTGRSPPSVHWVTASCRSRWPPVTPLAATVQQVYATALAAERAASEPASSRHLGGATRREIAVIGRRQIERPLAELGIESYQAWMLQALPAEVAARGRLVTTSYARPAAAGPIADLLAAVADLDGTLDELVDRLEQYQALGERLVSAAAVLQVTHSLDRSVTAPARHRAGARHHPGAGQHRPGDGRPDAHRGGGAGAAATGTGVAAGRGRPAFAIALALLHTEMVAAFAAEVADGAAPATALQRVPMLCDAVHDGVVTMAATARRVDSRLREVTSLVGQVSPLTEFGSGADLVM